MRNHVIFRHPAEFVPVSGEDGILSADSAEWFMSLLRQIPGLEIEAELCQEDWGVVAFLPKPTLIIDDQAIQDWNNCQHERPI